MQSDGGVPEVTDLSIPRAEGTGITFLARALKLMYEYQLVNDQTFVDVIPPDIIAQSLEDQPDHRANILSDTGIVPNKKYGRRTDTENTSVYLTDYLLDNQDPGKIRMAVPFDEWPKILSRILIWKLIMHAGWVLKISESTSEGSHPDPTRNDVKALVALLSLMDELRLISPREKYEQLGIGRLLEVLPVQFKNSLLTTAITYGEIENRPFKAENLFGVVTPEQLVRYVKIEILWEKIILYVASKQKLLIVAPEGTAKQNNAIVADHTSSAPQPQPVPYDESRAAAAAAGVFDAKNSDPPPPHIDLIVEDSMIR